MQERFPLILPVENQVRELDPKLLLACAAAERGLPVVMGSRTEVDFAIASLPRGFYLAKGMTPKNAKMFGIMRSLGHEIAVLEEEALVYLFPDHYYWRKMGPETLQHVSLLLAWGSDNVELFRKAPAYDGTPIRIVGSPRGDMLRSELRGYFDDDVARIRDQYGDFALINTNFSMVNAFLPTQNLLVPAHHGEPPLLGAAAFGVKREFAEAFSAHKTALYRAFHALLPELSRAFPDFAFVLRPHPGEDRAPWEALGATLPNVHVVLEGSVVPWLLAARALVHNGCTTAVEAHALGLPALTYRPVKSPTFDFELPNGLSHEATNAAELVDLLGRVIAGDAGPSPEAAPRPFREYLAALDGPLSSDRIVDAILEAEDGGDRFASPGALSTLSGWWRATRRRHKKRLIKARNPGHRNSPAFQRHRFAGASVEDLQARIERLGRQLGRFDGVVARPGGDHMFRIERGATSP